MIKSDVLALIGHVDLMSKLILAILLCCSIICWAIFFYKVILLAIKKRDIVAMMKRLQVVESVSVMNTIAKESAMRSSGYLLIALSAAYKKYDKVPHGKSLHEMISYDTELIIEQMVMQDEEHIVFITTSAAVSPLLGLFGTVWGLIHAFVDMSQTQIADISTVAPGVAEALITTLAGLLVAIPALVMSNYLACQLRHIERNLILLAEKVHAVYAYNNVLYKEGLCTNAAVSAGQEFAR